MRGLWLSADTVRFTTVTHAPHRMDEARHAAVVTQLGPQTIGWRPVPGPTSTAQSNQLVTGE